MSGGEKNEREEPRVWVSTTDPQEMMEIIKNRNRMDKGSFVDDSDLSPPWCLIPGYPMDHIGWRMGSGEDVRHRFFVFFTSLDHETRELYKKEHPEPEGWLGYYEMIMERHKQLTKAP